MTDADALLARDIAHRSLALDVRQSFLVQSPAGSGKTELLIQRYLALLGIVERPEQVLAMTFTRKAAAEMRARIVDALREAAELPADGPTPAATSDHHARTRALAAAALARDRAHGWDLVAHPARLAVYTIDAFCASVVRQAPLATGLGSLPRFEEHADALYGQAAREALAAAAVDDAQWRALLAHLDNDAERVVTLLSSMLAKRDQWLRHVGLARPGELRGHLERALQLEIAGELDEVRRRFPRDALVALARCAGYAVGHLEQSDEGEDLAQALSRCVEDEGLPPAHWQRQDDWRALANWLLVKGKPQFRKSINERGGFPAQGTGAGKAERAARKQAVEELLRALDTEAGLADALHLARSLPPAAYTEEAWAIVAALLAVLPRAATELALVFAAEGVVDFVELTLAALRALGSADAPTDLLLRLDARYDHLLVDEFQDTSDVQYELLGSLTAGWTDGDGRTLFAVGDPMQSIYRFRDAEVRLFLDAQEKSRVGNVPVRVIDLTRNFRSQEAVVHWVNDVFPGVLGPHSSPWRGAVSFAPAVAMRAVIPDVRPTVDLLDTVEAEAECVVRRVTAALAANGADIAILVRARSHLDQILPALRAANIPFAAVELDALGTRQSMLDLTSLAHALLQPADRLAALAVLRAPWCGLVLADLLTVSTHIAAGLHAVLAGHRDIVAISDDGHARLDRIAAALLPAFAERGRVAFSACIRGAWLALGGPATVDEAIDLDAASRFFALLAAHETGGDIRDWNRMLEALAVMYPTPATGSAARVQVMTLHHAKGLEFDTVILPGLARGPSGSDRDLLRWRTRPGGLLLAPINARGGDKDPVYSYLELLATAEADHELGRLLYVGATRARSRLHLIGTAEIDPAAAPGESPWKTPQRNAALAKLWPALALPPPLPTRDPDANAERGAPPLVRLAAGFAMPELADGTALRAGMPATASEALIPFEWAHATAAAIGTVTHRLLAQVARDGIATWSAERVAALQARITMALRSEGVDDERLARAAADVDRALRGLLADPRGRWLFDPTHGEAVSEWALAAVDDGAIVHVSLDRTFVADGVRWIVDFKTGRHEGGDTQEFLAREEERYRAQLERYARIVRGFDPRRIRLALYFPLVDGGWREWPYEDQAAEAGIAPTALPHPR